MRLNELQGVKKHLKPEIKTFSDLQDYMKELGFEYINKGKYGAVFDKPGADYVVKIIKDDSCYLDFVRYCKDNQNNPHLPKIKGNIIKLGHRGYLVRLEKLTPLSPAEFKETGIFEFLRKYEDKFWMSPDERKLASDFEEQNKKMANTLIELKERTPMDCHFDLHEDNVMKRGNTYVIIDPYSGIFGSSMRDE